jgi:hypothetical protein
MRARESVGPSCFILMLFAFPAIYEWFFLHEYLIYLTDTAQKVVPPTCVYVPSIVLGRSLVGIMQPFV